MPTIGTNTIANTALRYTNINTNEQGKYLNQLSSGLRVNKAGDDPAALSIGSKIKSDSAALRQAGINIQTVSSALNIAEGGLNQTLDTLIKLKGIISNALSGVPDTVTLTNLNISFLQLRTQVQFIATSTTFNGQNLLAGTGGANTFGNTAGAAVAVGPAATDTILTSISATGAGNNATITDLGIAASVVDTVANATTAQTAVNTAIDRTIALLAKVGGLQVRFESQGANVGVLVENAEAAGSAVLEADVAFANIKANDFDTKAQAGISAIQKANSQKLALLRLLQS